MVGSDAVPAGLAKRTPGARAAPGLRPPAIRPAARSSLMVRATHRKTDQPPEARPGVVTTPRWSAAGRRRLSLGTPRTARCDPRWAPRGAPSPRLWAGGGKGRQAAPGLQTTGAMALVRAGKTLRPAQIS